MSQKKVLLLILAVFVLAGGLAVWNAQRQLANRAGQQTPKNGVGAEDVVGENVSFTVTEAEHKKWDFVVKKALYFRSREGAKLQDIKGQFYNTAGEVVAHFQAPYGEFINENDQIHLSGGTLVTIGPSLEEAKGTLKSPTLTWSSKSDKVLAEKGVVLVTTGYGETTADRCRFKLDFSEMNLEGNTVTRMKL